MATYQHHPCHQIAINSRGGRTPPPFLSICLATASRSEIAEAISQSGGVLLVRGLSAGAAPLQDVAKLFDRVAANAGLQVRANKAYTKNLIYKDSFAAGNGGKKIDQKRVLDLSPARLDVVTSVDPGLEAEFGEPLAEALAFFNDLRSVDVPRLLAALADAAGAPSIADDALCNYRMLDYYQRCVDLSEPGLEPPRCGEHHDFGSLTLIFQDTVGGLEVFVNEQWVPVRTGGTHEAVVLFGWCSTFRSNGRVPAVLHRVTRPPTEADAAIDRRRLSAVLFVAPEASVSLAPVVLSGERALFKDVTAGTLREEVGRKWKYREGTLNKEGRAALESRARRFRPTQSYIAHAFGTNGL